LEFSFPWPMSQGEWLAFGAAAATAAIGLWHFVALLFIHFPAALVIRSQAAGLQIGIGLVAMLMAQPLVYLALGAGWALAALLQLIAMARHGRAEWASLVALLISIALGGLPAAYVFGLV
jgi:hypothetical protein